MKVKHRLRQPGRLRTERGECLGAPGNRPERVSPALAPPLCTASLLLFAEAFFSRLCMELCLALMGPQRPQKASWNLQDKHRVCTGPGQPSSKGCARLHPAPGTLSRVAGALRPPHWRQKGEAE